MLTFTFCGPAYAISMELNPNSANYKLMDIIFIGITKSFCIFISMKYMIQKYCHICAKVIRTLLLFYLISHWYGAPKVIHFTDSFFTYTWVFNHFTSGFIFNEFVIQSLVCQVLFRLTEMFASSLRYFFYSTGLRSLASAFHTNIFIPSQPFSVLVLVLLLWQLWNVNHYDNTGIKQKY